MVGRNSPVWLFFANAMIVMQRPVLCAAKTMMNVELKFREAMVLRLNCSNIWSHVIERNTMKYVNFAQKIINCQLNQKQLPFRSDSGTGIESPGMCYAIRVSWIFERVERGGGIDFGEIFGFWGNFKVLAKNLPLSIDPMGEIPHDSGQEGGGTFPNSSMTIR